MGAASLTGHCWQQSAVQWSVTNQGGVPVCPGVYCARVDGCSISVVMSCLAATPANSKHTGIVAAPMLPCHVTCQDTPAGEPLPTLSTGDEAIHELV